MTGEFETLYQSIQRRAQREPRTEEPIIALARIRKLTCKYGHPRKMVSTGRRLWCPECGKLREARRRKAAR